MRVLIAALLLVPIACAGPRHAGVNTPGREYRVSRLLRLAVHLQSLDVPAREARLRELSRDPGLVDDFFPLCRMLFEARPEAEFRRPLISLPWFAGGTDFKDWPLEPITIYRGLPLSIVRGYELAGYPESPQQYLEYCLSKCAWRRQEFEYVDRPAQRALIAEFIQSNPGLAGDSKWLLAQAD